MRAGLFLVLAIALAAVVESRKILIIAPGISKSQIGFNAKIGKVLASEGHNVTMLVTIVLAGFNYSSIDIDKRIRVIDVNTTSRITVEDFEAMQSKIIFTTPPFYDTTLWKTFDHLMTAFRDSCRALLMNTDLLDYLRKEQFEVGFSHMYNKCPIGILHVIGVKPWVWLNSGSLMDHVAMAVGVPVAPSHVPPYFMGSTDEMSIIQRGRSLCGYLLTKMVSSVFVDPVETAMFREFHNYDFPSLSDLAKDCPLVMVNSNDLYDFPRPTLAKVVNIGCLEFDTPNPLSQDLEKIAERGKGMVIFSFGSLAPAHSMPEEWKSALLEAFRLIPDYEFVMRYEGEDLDEKLPPNVHLKRWLPQTDLLMHDKTAAFFTHAGYNSLQEAISAGVPMVTLALFGDQLRNAKVASKRGIAVELFKPEMSNAGSIRNAIERVLFDGNYTANAKRLQSMVRNQPVSSKTLLLRWTEFLAEYKTLENFVPTSQDLSWFQYYLLDVVTAVVWMSIVNVLLLGCCFRCFQRGCLAVSRYFFPPVAFTRVSFERQDDESAAAAQLEPRDNEPEKDEDEAEQRDDAVPMVEEPDEEQQVEVNDEPAKRRGRGRPAGRSRSAGRANDADVVPLLEAFNVTLSSLRRRSQRF